MWKYDARRANKQILESTQQIAVASHMRDFMGGRIPTKNDLTPYSVKRHQHHPCTKWTYASKANFMWHVNCVWALIAEYQRLTGKTHACALALQRAQIAPDYSLSTEAPPFVGSAQYCSGIFTIIESHSLYEKYFMYTANKWIIQDKTPDASKVENAFREFQEISQAI